MDSVRKVYTLTEAIIDFILERKHLKSITVLQIYNVVTKIQNTVAPLLPGHDVAPYLLRCLADTESVLLSAWQNLGTWNDGRSRRLRTLITGHSGTGKLKEDRDRLVSRQDALLGAVQIVTDVKGYNIVVPSSATRYRAENKSTLSLKMRMKMPEDQSSVFEADHFWKCYVGDEVGGLI